MTRRDVLAQLDQRFHDHMAEEIARMRAEGLGERLIEAVLEDNRRRYAELREKAADQVLNGDAADGQTRH